VSAPVTWEALYLLSALVVAVIGATAVVMWMIAGRMLRVVERIHELEMRLSRLEQRP
jgi:uncharacterized membrane protein YciS (DUF1049 family)